MIQIGLRCRRIVDALDHHRGDRYRLYPGAAEHNRGRGAGLAARALTADWRDVVASLLIDRGVQQIKVRAARPCSHKYHATP